MTVAVAIAGGAPVAISIEVASPTLELAVALAPPAQTIALGVVSTLELELIATPAVAIAAT